MKWLKSLAVVALVSLTSSSALAAGLGPSSPPPGITLKAWSEMWGRANRAAKLASKLVSGSRVECLRAVFLRLLGDIEVGSSADAAEGNPAADGLEVTVHPRDAKQFNAALTKERDDQCRDEGGGGAGKDVEAVARFATENPEWETENYKGAKGGKARAKAQLSEAIDYLKSQVHVRPASTSPVVDALKAGVLVPAAEATSGGTLAPAGLAPAIIVPKPDCRMQGLLGGKQDPSCQSL